MGEEEDNYENKKDIDLDEVEYDYNDEYSQSFNYSFKRRGTLIGGVYEDDNYLQNNQFDFEE